MQVEINDQIINVVVEKKRNKNMYFRFSDASTLHVTCPHLTPSSYILSCIKKNIVSLSTKGDLLTIKSVSNEKGKAEMKMNIKKDNKEDITISFSAKYMMEALNALNTDEIEMSFVGEVKPIIIKNTNDDGLLQLVVPIRTY